MINFKRELTHVNTVNLLKYLNIVVSSIFIVSPLLTEVLLEGSVYDFKLLLLLNLTSLSIYLTIALISKSQSGDKFLIIGPPIINGGFIFFDISISILNSEKILTSIYFDLMIINFISLILLVFVYFTKPFFLQNKSTFIQPYVLIWFYGLIVGSISLSLLSKKLLLITTVLLGPSIIIAILYESKINNIVFGSIVDAFNEESVKLYSPTNISHIRHLNIIALPNTISQIKKAATDELIDFEIYPIHQDGSIRIFKNNTKFDTLLNRFDESNMFSLKGKLLGFFLIKEDSSKLKDKNFFSRTLLIILVASSILMISLFDFGNPDFFLNYNNLLYGLILVAILLVIYFFYMHPVFKDLIPLIFGEKKLMIFENGIWINITHFEDDLRYLAFNSSMNMQLDLKTVTFNINLHNDVLKLDLKRFLYSPSLVSQFAKICNYLEIETIEEFHQH